MFNWLEKHSKISWTLTIIIAITIFLLSSIEFYSSGIGQGSNLKSILYHIVIFFFLSFFLLISIVQGKYKNLLFLGILLSITYGILDELHQSFVPGRAAAFSDVLLDSLGILFAFMVYYISLEYRSSLSKKTSIPYTN